MSDALPLPPHPNLEQYKKLAKDLQRACKLGDEAVRDWAARWDGERVARQWQKIRKSHERMARCTLAGAQFFVARCHCFASWPKFAQHVEALERANSLESKFEWAADAIVNGDLTTLEKLLITFVRF